MTTINNVLAGINFSTSAMSHFSALLKEPTTLRQQCEEAPQSVLAVLSLVCLKNSSLYKKALRNPVLLFSLVASNSAHEVARLIVNLPSEKDRRDALLLEDSLGNKLGHYLVYYGAAVEVAQIISDLRRPETRQEMLELKNDNGTGLMGSPLIHILVEFGAISEVLDVLVNLPLFIVRDMQKLKDINGTTLKEILNRNCQPYVVQHGLRESLNSNHSITQRNAALILREVT